MEYGYDLGAYSRVVTTASAEAQRWFDRGLNWIFGFNHAEAVACFERALSADPGCAMAQWGIAYAMGPNYNMPWALYDEAGKAAALARAHAATQAALALADRVSPPEQALIRALAARYPQVDPIADMRPWDRAFADAMRAAQRAYPHDLDILSVTSEAIMDLTPWQMWDLATGQPAPRAGTPEVRALLEGAMRDLPGAMAHPGILHLYVHLMEMSPFPEKALPAADVLRTLVPDAGHLVHMPTHIDVLCGNYHDALHWNHAAIAADRKYLDREGVMNFYTGYRVHDYHFAVYGAMFLGQYKPALAAAEELIATMPADFLRIASPPMADFFESYLAVKQHVYVRFGKWEEIIAQDLPEDPVLFSNLTAMIHYAKGVAHAALGHVDRALAEQALFRAARARVPETRLLHNNTCQDLFAIAEEMLSGEIEYRRGNYDAAFAHLRASVAADDNLPYDEPWGWMQPTRHALGALLLEQGRVAEAEAVYREDLGLGGNLTRAQIHPDNIWALRGLMECLEARGAGATPEARLIRQRLDLAQARSDLPVEVSCFCARGRAG
ncbi:MAG: tetratricopeptide repeat protein [Rhodobacterales bacterium]|nr:tetratricopeptide repeat protein [Rhodobacterales bacterium]MDX5389595.1 tetratricopeptide repeat protein [Rhodobacterales bacterium]MDX5489292.1 tetratricopeptide repeat protein [Rhodobacterales bacterium]